MGWGGFGPGRLGSLCLWEEEGLGPGAPRPAFLGWGQSRAGSSDTWVPCGARSGWAQLLFLPCPHPLLSPVGLCTHVHGGVTACPEQTGTRCSRCLDNGGWVWTPGFSGALGQGGGGLNAWVLCPVGWRWAALRRVELVRSWRLAGLPCRSQGVWASARRPLPLQGLRRADKAALFLEAWERPSHVQSAARTPGSSGGGGPDDLVLSRLWVGRVVKGGSVLLGSQLVPGGGGLRGVWMPGVSPRWWGRVWLGGLDACVSTP